jgi:glyoxylase-like metal-dependent hydrolase (beta-lactamase superfamily II)/GNAT superfamily N-acetyltransferase
LSDTYRDGTNFNSELIMKIISYLSRIPLRSGEFVERNPNISYLLTSAGEKPPSVLIDASVDPQALKIELLKNRSVLTHILITHNHPDHITSLSALMKMFPDTRLGVPEMSLSGFSAYGYTRLLALKNNIDIKFGDAVLTVLHTPGHTYDSMCYWSQSEKAIFTGDTLFGGGIGCADYDAGGNRNIFYKTIDHLLKLLDPESQIFPGHFSEKYQAMPPYNLSGEKDNNPYVKNVLEGKRGAFDRDLKTFSVEFESFNTSIMDEHQVDRLYKLETQSWIPELQASRELILSRIQQGHQILGLEKDAELLGMVCWRYSGYSIHKGKDRFPRSFMEFSGSREETGQRPWSAFIYNVGVKAGFRQIGTGSLLLQEAFHKIRERGVSQVFVDCRMPSYNGSQRLPNERIKPNSEFKEAIDRYFATGEFPAKTEFELDPRLRFYMKNGFQPWLLLDNFINDFSSGNKRLICFINLEQDDHSFHI